jgi:hypothetical protein
MRDGAPVPPQHLPSGVATQREDLRAKFPGKPEHVVNFFTFVAEEIREYLASIGVRKLEQIIGRADLLRLRDTARNPKTADVDLSPLFYQVETHENSPHRSNYGAQRAARRLADRREHLQDARDAISLGVRWS